MIDLSKRNLLIQYLNWHFYEVPENILKAWRNFLLFNLNFFSLPLLFRTFFSYWRRYRWYYPRGFEIGKYLEVLFSNLFSRVVGAVMRSFLIITGLLIEILIIFVGAIIFLGWLILPLLLIGGLWFGFKIIL